MALNAVSTCNEAAVMQMSMFPCGGRLERMIREAWMVSSHTSEEILIAKAVEVKLRNCEHDFSELLFKKYFERIFKTLLFVLTYFYTSTFYKIMHGLS